MKMLSALLSSLLLFASLAQASQINGTANQVVRVPPAGGIPRPGSIDLSQAAAVGTSLLGEANGGSGTVALGGRARNLALGTPTVATNALTIPIKQIDGVTDPSATAPAKIPFRNASATNGGRVTRSLTAALFLTVPSGASLGQVSGMNQYVWVYLLDDAGVIDECVSGVTYFDPAVLQTVTQISAAATSGSTLYCNLAHTGAHPAYLVGRLLVNEAVAGTWASAPVDVQLNPGVRKTETAPVAFSPVINGSTSGTVTPGTGGALAGVWHREGRYMVISESLLWGNTATLGVGTWLFTIPNSGVYDTSQAEAGTGYHSEGSGWYYVSGAWDPLAPQAGTTTTNFEMISTGGAISPTIPAAPGVSNAWAFTIRIPILGWSEYGP